MLQRRAFLMGLCALVAAPAIVRASSLMPVKALPREMTREEILALLSARIDAAHAAMDEWMRKSLYADVGDPPLPLGPTQYVRSSLSKPSWANGAYGIRKDCLMATAFGEVIVVNG